MTKAESEFLRAIDIQFDIVADHMEHGERMRAFKAKEGCKAVLLKVFRALGAAGFADFGTKMEAWSNALIIFRARELLAITSKLEMTDFVQTALLLELGIDVTEEEKEAYKLYASGVAHPAGVIIGNHIHSVLNS